MSIGKYAREVIINNPGLSNQQILDEVKMKFPEGQTTVACIAWYKSDMKKKGYKAEPIKPVERTVEIIRVELENAKLKVMELEEELDAKVESTRDEMMAKFKALAEELGINVE